MATFLQNTNALLTKERQKHYVKVLITNQLETDFENLSTNIKNLNLSKKTCN